VICVPSIPQESLDREQLKLGQHLRQEIKARKAAEKTINDSLAAAAAAAAADLAALAGKTDASAFRLRERCEGLAAQQKRAQEQHAGLAGECSALQQVGGPHQADHSSATQCDVWGSSGAVQQQAVATADTLPWVAHLFLVIQAQSRRR
jgi:hypothetical protein